MLKVKTLMCTKLCWTTYVRVLTQLQTVLSIRGTAQNVCGRDSSYDHTLARATTVLFQGSFLLAPFYSIILNAWLLYVHKKCNVQAHALLVSTDY